MKIYFALMISLMTGVIQSQDLTQDYRKLILNSPNSISLFQTNSTGGIWASGMITGDRWAIFEDATSSKEHFTVLAGGNIGIGTTNPGAYKLAVNGNVRAKEVKVETGWADYVFAENYDLPTLEEVAQHIKEKGHLINIPSAAEVETNGIQLGEMNKLLLEKIEELTLYTIEQQMEINELRELKTQNRRLNQKLKEIEEMLLGLHQTKK